MIEENVHEHRRISAPFLFEKRRARVHERMHIRKIIDTAVQCETGLDAVRKCSPRATFHPICNEISDENLGIFGSLRRKNSVREQIHLLCCSCFGTHKN